MSSVGGDLNMELFTSLMYRPEEMVSATASLSSVVLLPDTHRRQSADHWIGCIISLMIRNIMNLSRLFE